MNKNTANTIRSHGNGNHSETTKNAIRKRGKHDVNLQKRGFLRFQAGLILAMLLVYFGLETSFETFEPPIVGPQQPEMELVEYHADANHYKIEKPFKEPRIQKKTTNPNFEIIEDDAPEAGLDEFIQEQIDDFKEGVVAIDSLKYEDPNDNEPLDVIISVVEEVPIFPGCENVNPDKRLECFNKMVERHIQKNVRYPNPEQEMGIQGKVNTLFKIDIDGTITGIRLKGPSPGLEKEAERIINMLPKMEPGRQKGKPVRVSFSIPISFKLKH